MMILKLIFAKLMYNKKMFGNKQFTKNLSLKVKANKKIGKLLDKKTV